MTDSRLEELAAAADAAQEKAWAANNAAWAAWQAAQNLADAARALASGVDKTPVTWRQAMGDDLPGDA